MKLPYLPGDILKIFVTLRTELRFAVLAMCSAALWLGSAGIQAQAPVAPLPSLVLGAAWYPEQWPEARWDADLELMHKAGITMVRVGEFAWSQMEPSDGHYDLDWLDRAVTAAGRHGIYTVIGTPSAAPPAWLTQKYPETLRTMEDGRKDGHGNRQQFNFANPKYLQLSRAMAEQLAKRFGHNPLVIGWQIDNEYANSSYDDETKGMFQGWLKSRYKTLDALNTRWTTSYWSETYSNWNQVPIQTKYGNPGLLLSWKRFVSDTWRGYQLNQTQVIRANSNGHQFITTNMMGWFDGYDHYTVAQDLDLASWDDYVGQGQLDPYYNGAAHDLTRGFLRKNFWVMETQPGAVNWQQINNALDKGEVRAMAWHAIGHGADAVSYWQWRSALNGQEQYHGTLVGTDGTPVPLYAEVAQLGAEFAKAAPALAGTSVQSDVAILHSYDSRWAINWQRHNTNFDPVQELVSYYKPLRDLAQSIDIVNPSVSLNQYKLVVAPGLNVLSDAEAKNLIAYVQQGGHLVLGQRSAMKDEDNSLQVARQPGPLAELLGGRVDQYYALIEPIPIYGEWTKVVIAPAAKGAVVKANSKDWAELLSTTSPETKVLLRYGKSNGWLDDQPAAITRKVGKGSITYIGAWLDPATMASAAKWMIATAGVQPKLGKVPAGVDVYPRTGPHGNVYIMVNFAKTAQTVSLPTAMQDVLKGGTTRTLTLPHYGVSVVSAAR
jgi:beta-galactosidase